MKNNAASFSWLFCMLRIIISEKSRVVFVVFLLSTLFLFNLFLVMAVWLIPIAADLREGKKRERNMGWRQTDE